MAVSSYRPYKAFLEVSGFTYASTIMVSEEQPYLIAAPGPPDQHDYTVFRFATDGKRVGFLSLADC
jgi:hypothetical protein